MLLPHRYQQLPESLRRHSSLQGGKIPNSPGSVGIRGSRLLTITAAATAAAVSHLLRSGVTPVFLRYRKDLGNLSGSAVTPTAAVAMFTANPTVGTTVATINVKPLLAGPPGGDGCVFFQYGPASSTGPLVILPGRQLAVNLQGITLPTGFSATSTISTTEQ